MAPAKLGQGEGNPSAIAAENAAITINMTGGSRLSIRSIPGRFEGGSNRNMALRVPQKPRQCVNPLLTRIQTGLFIHPSR